MQPVMVGNFAHHHTVEALYMGTALHTLSWSRCHQHHLLWPIVFACRYCHVLCLCSCTASSGPYCSSAVAQLHRWPACKAAAATLHYLGVPVSPSMTRPLCKPLSLYCGKHCTITAAVLSPGLQIPPVVSSAVVLQASCKNCLQDSRRVQRCKEVPGPGLCICEAAGTRAFRAGCHAGAGWGVRGCPGCQWACQF